MYSYNRNTQTDNERYLEDQVRQLQAEREQQREDERRAREERMEAAREQAEINARSANTWPEALRKQAYLFQREANQWPADDPDFPDDYFGPGAKACERALEIWSEVMAGKQEEILALQEQIRAIKDSIRLEVADKLEAESDADGWKHVAGALREYTDKDCEYWLDW